MPVFTATTGDDIIPGSEGTVDTVDYSQGARSGGVKIFLYPEGWAITTGNSGTDTLTSIENVVGTDFNDDIAPSYTDNELWGMGGDDRLSAYGGHDIVHGGAGDDTIEAILNRADSAVVFGDAGNDSFRIDQGEAGAVFTADGGSGDDYFLLRTIYDSVTLTLGGGQDQVVLDRFQSVVPSLTITDFQAGEDGDSLDLTAYLAVADPSWTSDVNPFVSGLLRLVTVSGGTQVQVQVAGTWHDLALLQGVAPGDLTPHNFAGFPVDGSEFAGVRVDQGATAGTPGDDNLQIEGIFIGSVYGGLGDDVLSGGHVIDAPLYGGPGDDTFTGDIMFGGRFLGGPGHDTYLVTRGVYLSQIWVEDFNPAEDVIRVSGFHADRATIVWQPNYPTSLVFYDGTQLVGILTINTTPDQLNSSNLIFVDADPLETAPTIASTAAVTTPMVMSSAYAVSAGSVLHFEHDGVTLRNAAANFTNAGTVVATYGQDSYSAIGVDFVNFAGTGLPTITNTASGHVLITSSADGTVLANGGNVTAIAGGLIVNQGDVQAVSRGGSAAGVHGNEVNNSGTIRVWAFTEGFGATGHVINTGTIEVHGVAAYGVTVSGPVFDDAAPLDTANWTFFNSGSISAYGSVSGGAGHITVSGAAVMVRPVSSQGAHQTFYNSGTLAGDYSFYADESGSSPHVRQGDFLYNVASGVMTGTAHFDDGNDHFDNAGAVTGKVDMGADDDWLGNSGAITGDVELGDGDDSYLGATGLQSGGGIYGGAGNDVVEAGAGAQAVFGGTGDDVLSGGAGNDWIDGGLGLDTMAGGEGIDTLSYRSALGAVSIDLAANTAGGSAQGDTISGFESVVGGRYDDTLSGTSGVNRIEGGRGDDRLTGLGGADLFVFARGDGHDTVTDFRAGGDADRIDVWGYTAWQSVTQVGTDALVRFDAHNSLLLSNTSAASVTTGLFSFHASSDPHVLSVVDPALAGTQPLFVGQDMTLLADEVLDFSFVSQRQIGTIPAVRVAVGTSFESYGRIVIQGPLQSVGINAPTESSALAPPPSHIINHAGATIDVLAAGAAPERPYAIGIFASTEIVNAGDIHVRSAWYASGIRLTADIFSQPSFDNSGTLEVRAVHNAYGVEAGFGAISLTNSGTITASSEQLAVGFHTLTDGSDITFNNSGTIIAMASPRGEVFEPPYHDMTAGAGAVAFNVSGGHYINSGTVRAEFAFYARNIGQMASEGVETIENTGAIYGRSKLFSGDDRVFNSGLIDGAMDLGAGNDLYDGRGGTQYGGVLGGDGDDMFIGGASDEVFDGGDGVDTLNFASAAQAVSLDLTDGVHIVAGQGADTLSNFENVIGSTFADHLGGNASANVIDGGRGNDIVSSGAGSDAFVLRHGDGVDTITDFDVAADILDLSDPSGFDRYLSVTQEGNDTRIVFSATDSILLQNVSAATLGAGNFRFISETGPLYLPGTDGNDVLAGHLGPNTIDGFGGDDSLTGNAGSDVLRGGDGDDVLAGGGNNDRLDGGAGFDTASFADSAGFVVASLVDGGVYIWSLSGTIGGTLIAIERLVGSAFNDSFNGSDAANTLEGLAGDDMLNGGAGADTLIGGEGNDTYYVDNAGDTVSEANNQGTDTVVASIGFSLAGRYVENLLLTGTAHINATGNGLNNRLSGNAGNNLLNGGAGADVMSGGDGDDTYVVDSASDTVTESFGGGNDTVQSGLDFVLGQNVENLVLTGTAINGTGNGLNNALTGNAAANILSGGDGHDRLDGDAGADLLSGGAGDDTYVVDNVLDRITEGNNRGMDTIEASVSFALLGSYVETLILTGAGHISATGNGLANALSGNGGNNTLNGNRGADHMAGGAGNDLYYVENVGDVIVEGANAGTDTVIAQVSFVLPDQVEKLAFSGYQTLNGTGNGLDNTLAGNGNVNALNGAAGNDVLIGLGGNDVLTGGAGADQFRFARAGAANGLDHLTDFVSGTDKLMFIGADYGFARGHILTAAELHSGGAVGAFGQFLYNAVNHILYWDGDGAGGTSAIAVAVFDNAAMPTTTDFVFL